MSALLSTRPPLPLAGDILLFRPDPHTHSALDYVLEEAIVFGEHLEHTNARGPMFCHVGIMLSSDTFAEEDGTAHEAALASVPASQHLYCKRLPLTPAQRLAIPEAAQALYGTRYDLPLDFYLGTRYLWHGIASTIHAATFDLVQLPALHIGEEAHHRLICSTYVRAVLESVGYHVHKRLPSPEHYALMPGEMWRLQ